ncbi:hypothetical protein MIPYR_100038 [uncultured Microbacterium sp.]|uniref:Uncharacterized protein n=1 Tax=uncultured Microbacterium sp. TaxID=191216 RepID=A0A1Y5NXS9_9MICO|nr:hypothetical protein MIPYR_100038 [uncultured Microbacterium sp.]
MCCGDCVVVGNRVPAVFRVTEGGRKGHVELVSWSLVSL